MKSDTEFALKLYADVRGFVKKSPTIEKQVNIGELNIDALRQKLRGIDEK